MQWNVSHAEFLPNVLLSSAKNMIYPEGERVSQPKTRKKEK